MEKQIFKDHEEYERKETEEIIGQGNFYCANGYNQANSFVFFKRNLD